MSHKHTTALHMCDMRARCLGGVGDQVVPRNGGGGRGGGGPRKAQGRARKAHPYVSHLHRHCVLGSAHRVRECGEDLSHPPNIALHTCDMRACSRDRVGDWRGLCIMQLQGFVDLVVS